MAKMKETGHIDRLMKKWWVFEREQVKNDKSSKMKEAIVLGYENVLFPFFWVAIGMLVSVVIIMGELCTKYVGVNTDTNELDRKSNNFLPSAIA